MTERIGRVRGAEHENEVEPLQQHASGSDTESIEELSNDTNIEMMTPDGLGRHQPIVPGEADVNNVRRNLFSINSASESAADTISFARVSSPHQLEDSVPHSPAILRAQIPSPVILSVARNESRAAEVLSSASTHLQETIRPQILDDTATVAIAGTSACEATAKESEEDGEQCIICLEGWTNSGDHRVASLQCGHLFGFSCITKWLKGQGARCPQCNCKARKADIRPLYARSIKTLDTAERDRALKELESEREVRRRLELEVAKYRLKYQEAQMELTRLRKQVQQQAQAVNSPSKNGAMLLSTQSSAANLSLAQSLVICRDGGCRVMLSIDYTSMIVVSQPTCNPIFRGYGLKKFNSLDYRACELFPVHTMPIRDIACNSSNFDGIVLTASTDKTVKLINVVNNAVVHTFSAETGVWSCTWNLHNCYQFFAGLHNGKVLLFDTRVPREEVSEFVCSTRSSTGPKAVSSLQYVTADASAKFSCGGLVVGRLDGSYFFESTAGSEFQVHELTCNEGSLTSVSLEPVCRHVMVSCRPGARCSKTRHLVCELSQTSLNIDGEARNLCQSNVVQTFYGSDVHTKLSRGRLIQSPVDANSTLACVGDEGSTSVLIWDVGSGAKLHTLPASDTVLDLCPVTVNNDHFLAALTEKTLKIFKWQV